LEIEVGAGAALAVGSVAASVALSGETPSRLRVRAVVEPRGSLVWAPAPLVVTAGADHRVDVVLEVSGCAQLWWRDELVLGRAGEPAGRCVLHHHADRGGLPWARHELAIGGPGWDAGAVVGCHRALGSVLTTDDAVARVGPAPTDAAAVAHVGSPLTTDAVARVWPAPTDAAIVAHLRPEAGGTFILALAADRLSIDEQLPVPQFPALQRSLHAAPRVDA
jgi:urease accessory protein